ncbi:BREX-2 system phosphatase PglZ [Azohydromonas australica]|uniref:BREX-2 system phosphatase PglZ n=1 Tax=Azohydromonas australica TaxID=364039 RepID=UPI0004262159|nr:BREX-2 system phosphatase PglZ [Azohydromonas australica]
MNVSTAQIAAQLEAELQRDAKAQALAIRCAARQPWPAQLQAQGRRFELRWCESMLALREALAGLEDAGPESGAVLLTPLGTHEIADDIAARLSSRRVFQPQGWDMVRQLFGARDTDARLGRHSWMPQMLIDGAAQGPYAPVASGFLDLETAWGAVLQRFLQLPDARPDAVTLLRWTLRPDADASMNLLPGAARSEAQRWLAAASGMAGAMAVACVEAGRTADALPLGLVCDVLFSPQGEGQATLGHAAIRLERYVGDIHVGVAEGRAWAAAARELVRHDGPERCRAALDRADRLLAELRAGEFAHLSTLLPSAFDQRLRAFGAAVLRHAQAPATTALLQVEASADQVLSHGLAAVQSQRAERVVMARRLCRWLTSPATTASSLVEAAAWQADEGAFVDWARFRLLGGDELPEVSEALLQLRGAVAARRNASARAFADALQAWNRQPAAASGRLVPVEQILDRVVAPLASKPPQRVLLLVVDGLSVSIFRELFAQPDRLGWAEWVPAGTRAPLFGAAALPTVTEVSRASLLCGRLTTGAAAQEKPGFASHAALQAASRADAPPWLFHKGDLSDAGNLASEVRAAIADSQQRVVGVVYNAVDDHLSGPDQLHQRWSLDDLRLLLPLLREAREAQRVVVVTADHGHLLEDGTRLLPGGQSDRWRVGNQVQTADEIVMEGSRVLTSDGERAVVALWSETARYTGRKNGYHGGVSPQEVIVPLSVFAPFGISLPDWEPAVPVQPEWWDLPLLSQPAVQSTVPLSSPAPAPAPASRRARQVHEAQQALFDAPIPAPAQSQPAVAPPDWIGALLGCVTYASQRQLAARVAPTDEAMRHALSALQERGGKLSRTALAQRLGLPEFRIGGWLSGARRVLNVDQVAVLSVDEASGTVEINLGLLGQQFGITVPGGAR